VPTSSRYHNPAMKQLADQQVRFAPVPVRMEQVDRAEELALTVDSDRKYSYPDLCETLTKYRAEMYPSLEVTGADLLHDLKCFVEDLSDSANLAADAASDSTSQRRPSPGGAIADLPVADICSAGGNVSAFWRRGSSSSSSSTRNLSVEVRSSVSSRIENVSLLFVAPDGWPGTGLRRPKSPTASLDGRAERSKRFVTR
jgi:hypothetical protein